MALLARRPAAAFVVALAAAAAGQTRWADLLFSGAKLVLSKAAEHEVQENTCEPCLPCETAAEPSNDEVLVCDRGVHEHGLWSAAAVLETVLMIWWARPREGGQEPLRAVRRHI